MKLFYPCRCRTCWAVVIYASSSNYPGTQKMPTEADSVWMGSCFMCMGMTFGVVHEVAVTGEKW